MVHGRVRPIYAHTLFHLVSSCFIRGPSTPVLRVSFGFILFHLVSSCFILFHFVSFRFISAPSAPVLGVSSCFISFHLVSSCFICFIRGEDAPVNLARIGWRWEDGLQGACCWKVGKLERERKRSNQSAVFQAGEPGAWANHLQCLVLDFVQSGCT